MTSISIETVSFFTRKHSKQNSSSAQRTTDSEPVVQHSKLDTESATTGQTNGQVVSSDHRHQVKHKAIQKTPTERGILNSLVANICVVDHEGTVIAVNSAWNRFAEQNDYTPEEISDDKALYGIGRNYFDICNNVFGEDAHAAKETAKGLEQVLNGNLERFSLEYPCHSPGQQRWYLLTISPVTADDGGAIISHFNITEQTELRRANAELDAFAQSLALDFRIPLGKMSESLSLLCEASDSIPSNLHSHVQQLTEGTKRLDSMVQDLLAYSRINRSSMNLRPVDLGQAVTDGLQRFSQEIQQSHAQISVAESFPRVMADQVLLTDAVAALLSNALKFVEPDTPPSVSIYTETLPDGICLWIEDQGTGIAENDLARIFNIFQRSQASGKYEGNGIGLAIVAKSMAQMGGSVEALPGEQCGSRLKLMFPKYRKDND